MRQIVSSIVVLFVVLVGSVVAQEPAPQAPPAPPASLVQATQAAADKDAKDAKIAELQKQLLAVTAPQRAEEQKKALTDLTVNVKSTIGEICKSQGGRWAWMTASVGNQPVTFIGCVGK